MTNDLNEKTFLLLKPDAIQRGLVGRIIARLEDKGLKLVAAKLVHVTRDQAMRQYDCHKGKPFFASLIDFITSSPSLAMVVEGRNSIDIVRKLMGATEPIEADPGTIRGDFALDVKHNLIHGSDCPESYRHEVEVYFTSEEIKEYKLELEPWIYYI
ncbi:MAG: nucleoside-diphosphate kinase [Clostridiales bacterium]|jgi:nucleoside-diphosphate kinase|nr:nucleoside-diphosphate kinase [Clostridiales bacterium]MDN5282989.1 nucleoside-diphosphate kinase [Candidatus Ozemobacter sp.]